MVDWEPCLFILASDPNLFAGIAFFPLKISDNIAASIPIDFSLNSKRCYPHPYTYFDYFCANLNGFWHHNRKYNPWEDTFNLGASANASEFCGWV